MAENPDTHRMSTPPNAQPPTTNHPSQGHEGNFIRPSDLLRPRRISKPNTPPKADTALDRDERAGLVSFAPRRARKRNIKRSLSVTVG